MPLRGPAKRQYHRQYMRRYRQKVKAAKAPPVEVLPSWPDNPGAAVAVWSAECLKVPPGHPNAGEPLVLPAYLVSFLRDTFAHRESLLCISRKNSKSTAAAILLLSALRGPTRTEGFRAGVVSTSSEKSRELQKLMVAIAAASGLEGIRFLKSPQARAVSASGEVDFHSAALTAGVAAGYDFAICDELGLLKERDRELVSGMRSSVSAKDGRFVSLSVRGTSPFVPEILARRGDPDLAVHLYESDPKLPIDDEDNWKASNPGLEYGIKSLPYMRTEARRVLATPADESSFRSLDLNQSVEPGRQMIVSLSDWQACVSDALPERISRAVAGWDLGGSSSMTAACIAFLPDDPEGPIRLEAYGAFPSTPSLADRSKADDSNYEEMARRDELRVYEGRITPAATFLTDIADRLDGVYVEAVGADRYRRAEALQALETAGVSWPIMWRGQGAAASADGSHDVRAFQKFVLSGRLRIGESLMMAAAIKSSSLRFDASGNPALAKAKANGRIDALSAAVIACGLAALRLSRKPLEWSIV